MTALAGGGLATGVTVNDTCAVAVAPPLLTTTDNVTPVAVSTSGGV